MRPAAPLGLCRGHSLPEGLCCSPLSRLGCEFLNTETREVLVIPLTLQAFWPVNSSLNPFRSYLEKRTRLVDQNTELNRSAVFEGTGMLRRQKGEGFLAAPTWPVAPTLPASPVCFRGPGRDGCSHRGLSAAI